MASEAREAALVSKHATELSHAVGRQRDDLRCGGSTQFKHFWVGKMVAIPFVFICSTVRVYFQSSLCLVSILFVACNPMCGYLQSRSCLFAIPFVIICNPICA